MAIAIPEIEPSLDEVAEQHLVLRHHEWFQTTILPRAIEG